MNLKRGERKDYGFRRDVERNTKLTEMYRKRGVRRLWTEICRSANRACPHMRINSIGRKWRRGTRWVGGHILRNTRWRMCWRMRIHEDDLPYVGDARVTYRLLHAEQETPQAVTGFFLAVWASSLNPLLGRTRSRVRCWAAIQLSNHPESLGHALHGPGEVDGLESGG